MPGRWRVLQGLFPLHSKRLRCKSRQIHKCISFPKADCPPAIQPQREALMESKYHQCLHFRLSWSVSWGFKRTFTRYCCVSQVKLPQQVALTKFEQDKSMPQVRVVSLTNASLRFTEWIDVKARHNQDNPKESTYEPKYHECLYLRLFWMCF